MDTPRNPRVYVLLLNWRGWEDTIECLESVFRQSYANYRVIVCDNNSPNESLERISEWAEGRRAAPLPLTESLRRLTAPPLARPIPYVQHDRAEAESGGPAATDAPLVLIQTGGNLGFAGGNNVGIRYVSERGDADYIWLLNNDTVIDPDALSTMVELAEADERIGIVGSKLLDYERTDYLQAAGGGVLVPWQGLTQHVGGDELDSGQWDQPFEPDYITGASLLIRTEVVESIGMLDERYFLYSEEVDWCLRTRRGDWKLVYCPGSRVWHKGGQTVVYKSSLHDYHTVRSMLLLVSKFYPRLLPVTFAYSMYKCLAPKLVRFQYGRLKAVLRAYRDFLADAEHGDRPTPVAGGFPTSS